MKPIPIPKPKTHRDREWLDHLRTQSCIITGMRTHDHETIDPAHIGSGTKGAKTHDYWALPIRHSIHKRMHDHGEMTVLREMLPDYVLRDALRAYAREQYEKWEEEQ